MSFFSTLAELSAGQSAVIEALSSGRAAMTRLREMGLNPGARVAVIRRAPMGEPLEVSVRGSHLALRLREAGQIRVRLTDVASQGGQA